MYWRVGKVWLIRAVCMHACLWAWPMPGYSCKPAIYVQNKRSCFWDWGKVRYLLTCNFDPRGSLGGQSMYRTTKILSPTFLQSSSDSAPFSHPPFLFSSYSWWKALSLNFWSFVSSSELSIQDPKLEVLDTHFCQNWGRNPKSGWSSSQETQNKEEKRTKLVFSPKSILTRISPPVWDLLHLQLHCCCSISSINQSLVRIETHKSLWTDDTQFHSCYWYTQIMGLHQYWCCLQSHPVFGPWFHTAISAVFIPNLSASYSRSEWIWAPSNKAGYSSGHKISRILFWQGFKFKEHYEPPMKMQVKTKPRLRAFPPHIGKCPFSLNLAAEWAQILMMLSSIEQILMLSDFEGPFCSDHFNSFTSFFLLWIWTVIITRPDVKT